MADATATSVRAISGFGSMQKAKKRPSWLEWHSISGCRRTSGSRPPAWRSPATWRRRGASTAHCPQLRTSTPWESSCIGLCSEAIPSTGRIPTPSLLRMRRPASASRLSTIQSADMIHVVDAGRIIESGKHLELLARGGVYANLHRLQFSDVDGAAVARLTQVGS